MLIATGRRKTMTFKAILTLLSVLILGSCTATTMDSGCAGWRVIWMQPGTPEWLEANDRRTLAGIVAHNETGQDRCGW
jgi:hypothetical protein